MLSDDDRDAGWEDDETYDWVRCPGQVPGQGPSHSLPGHLERTELSAGGDSVGAREAGADDRLVEVSGDGAVAFDAHDDGEWTQPLRISPVPVISPGRSHLVMVSLSASPSGMAETVKESAAPIGETIAASVMPASAAWHQPVWRQGPLHDRGLFGFIR
ncbi:hypothetical protein AQJ43_36810 [Streptomyces avermitilis]|uniref:Uncharacterized protein n=2 Tax=Streptomyces avermitilis TaxID=33903 RepID=A0A143SZU3_STRAW|nr:hypothetical protein [Streptomyces avermitilis]KUN47874.1 hypothetical protein AQJ43_36810 [Streptomyces avermitilis]BAU77476.1 hypothetical protein SAVERM_2p032 [Streptomyces avermitilis MA-4680 = NBRC 14893]BBJ56307.1 hypothetical protein SAVMC3_89360 [Streptomyces avermitilis]GDY70145.1 hypothetical protein SAV14893_095380 [Streptomyces avermitilis]GDY80442.1 hypothetical protein SAV31267_099270 [Streptomyces avermitilis]